MLTPSLAALEAFLAAAKHQSFRKAALERGVSPSALSHVIRSLEEALGIRLFNRTNRSIRLTEAGERLRQRLRPALNEVDRAVEDARASRSEPAGLLRLNVPRVTADLVVKPIIGRFLRAHPRVKLEVVSDDAIVDIVADGFDAGIRPGRRLAKDMIAVQIGPQYRFAVVGAPAYFSQWKKPQEPADLQAHACIERRYPNGTRYAWEFAKAGEAVEFDVSGPLIVDDSTLMIQAALDGIGLAHVFEGFVSGHIAAGKLTRVLEDWCPLQPYFFLYYAGRRQVPVPLRAFIDMARAFFAEPRGYA